MPTFWYVATPAPVPNVSIMTTSASTIRHKRTLDIRVTGDPASALDRYVLESGESGGAFAVVEHQLAPHVLAAPVHRHSREDEYSLVLEGRLGVWQDDDEVIASPANW